MTHQCYVSLPGVRFVLKAQALLPPAVKLHYHTVNTIWKPAAATDETDCVNVLECVCVCWN